MIYRIKPPEAIKELDHIWNIICDELNADETNHPFEHTLFNKLARYRQRPSILVTLITLIEMTVE